MPKNAYSKILIWHIFHMNCFFMNIDGRHDVIDHWTSASQLTRITEPMPVTAAFNFCTANMGDGKIALLVETQVIYKYTLQCLFARLFSKRIIRPSFSLL